MTRLMLAQARQVIDGALGKAAVAVGMGVDSRALVRRAKDLPAFFAAVPAVAQQAFVARTGALPVVDASGDVIGAAGASGGAGDEDEQVVAGRHRGCRSGTQPTRRQPRARVSAASPCGGSR